MFDTVVDSPKLDCQILNLHWWACVRSREQDCVTLAGSFLSYHLWETRSYAGCASEMMLRYIFSIVLIMLLLVSNMFYFSIDWEYHHPNWRTHIFQRGRSTTNQVVLCISRLPIVFCGWIGTWFLNMFPMELDAYGISSMKYGSILENHPSNIRWYCTWWYFFGL